LKSQIKVPTRGLRVKLIIIYSLFMSIHNSDTKSVKIGGRLDKKF